jgi:hypothetical protein
MADLMKVGSQEKAVEHETLISIQETKDHCKNLKSPSIFSLYSAIRIICYQMNFIFKEWHRPRPEGK